MTPITLALVIVVVALLLSNAYYANEASRYKFLYHDREARWLAAMREEGR